ncbi:MAG: glycosyltransferase family 2 protein [Candidatus Daviesbacteria bacterium]|nr:glycosyltransferase family 2 protein [Candidatus Daviesbacteria bacterium]
MKPKISVVINSLNEEAHINRALESVNWADEIIVCDMYSGDKTAAVAKAHGAKVFLHKREEYVEPARNFAISKASYEWILILDPDEEIPEDLAKKLQEIAGSMKQINYVRLPRKNMIFNHFMQASMWWPDYNIRFFKKDQVKWTDKIHQAPEAVGEGIDLPADEKLAIIHHHYNSLLQFLERMIRYTKIQAEELVKEGYKFNWKDLIKKPVGEFLSRFFANRGFEDGLHGLALSLLQAFSFVIVYLRVWEIEGFKTQPLAFSELKELSNQSGAEIKYWFKYANLSKNTFKRFFQKLRNKL